MERRKIRDEEDARACLEALKTSGLSAAQWCRDAGVDGRSLHAWAVNLERGFATNKPKKARAAKRVQLVELVAANPARGTALYRVRVGAHSVEVDDSFNESTLVRLIKVLASC